MSMTLNEGTLACADALTVEDAEALLQLLQDGTLRVDLAACHQVHAACLQALMAAAVPVVAWPGEDNLAQWLRAALDQQGEHDG